jgi:probable rRNA maturation factor
MSSLRTSNLADEFVISLANEQRSHAVDAELLISAARTVLEDSHFNSAQLSLAVVDDTTIHDLNRRHLNHDWPTDVLSFVLEDHAGHLEGEVIISADTAATAAAEVGWPAAAEQLLYVIHGVLHLVGYRDKTDSDAQQMRAAEREILSRFGFETPAIAGAKAR